MNGTVWRKREGGGTDWVEGWALILCCAWSRCKRGLSGGSVVMRRLGFTRSRAPAQGGRTLSVASNLLARHREKLHGYARGHKSSSQLFARPSHLPLFLTRSAIDTGRLKISELT